MKETIYLENRGEFMTLDEAIQRENKIAEENQKIVDTQIVFDDVSISELYCDDTEVIEEHLSNYRKCAEYHKQIAEWLEELKSSRQELNELRKYSYVQGHYDGYNNAIDDFYNEIVKAYSNMNNIPQVEKSTVNTIALGIAEQLKVGIAND